MRRFRNGTVIFDSADLAAAFGYPDPGSRCTACGHKRHEHRRVILQTSSPGVEHREESHECERWDRRRKTGVCACEKFTEVEGSGTSE